MQCLLLRAYSRTLQKASGGRERPKHQMVGGRAVKTLSPLLFLLVTSSLAQAAEPNPTALLKGSAAALESAESASLDVIVTLQITQGEQAEQTKSGYHFARLGKAKFSFEPVAVGEAPIGEGIAVRSDGELILTHPLSHRRYSLEESNAGFIDFIQSPFAQGIGNPLGGLGLSLLSTTMADQLASCVTSAEYLGKETLPSEGDAEEATLLHHCRYQVGGQFWFDAWFTVEEEARLQRLEADLSEIMTAGPNQEPRKDFQYIVTFDFNNWNLDAKLSADDFKLREPKGAELVDSFFQRPEKEPHPLLGKEAPTFELTDLQGDPVNLADHLGKEVILLDFWATWCPPCVAALPILSEAAESLADQGVVFFAVNQGEEAEQIQAFLDKKELDVPVVLDQQGATASSYSVEGLPTSVLIGKDGTVQVVYVGFGPSMQSGLVAKLESLLAGEDLATEKISDWQDHKVKRKEKLDRLRAKLAE